MMWNNGSGMGTGGWWLMGIAMITAWALIAAAIVWLVHRNRTTVKHHSPGGNRTAQDILDERYAHGELTDEEYRQHRDLLHTR